MLCPFVLVCTEVAPSYATHYSLACMSRNFFAIFINCIAYLDLILLLMLVTFFTMGHLRGARTGDLEDTFSEGTALQPVQRPGRIKAGNLH